MSEHTSLLQRFHQGIALLTSATAGISAAEADFVTAPGKWTIRQILAHLADSEVVNAMRYRQVIAEPNPTLQAYDQNLWAANLDYAHRDPAEAVETFRIVRLTCHQLMQALPADAFARAGTHSERGPLTLLDLLRLYTDHAEKHVAQIEGIRDAWRAAAKGQSA